MKQLGGILVGVLLMIGIRMYRIHEAKAEGHAALTKLCESDSECVAVVEKHYEGCFDDNSSFGGRWSGAKINSAGIVSCINTRSETEFFAYEPGEE